MGGGSPAPPPLISQPALGGWDQTGFDSQLKAAVEPGEESADMTEPSLRGTIFDFVCDIRCSLIKWAGGCLKVHMHEILWFVFHNFLASFNNRQGRGPEFQKF
jgi:hypothetical protein